MHSRIRFATVLCVCTMMLVSLCACGSVSIPDDYDYSDLSEYIELGKYKDLKYEKYDTDVTQSEVMEAIYSELDSSAEMKNLKSGTVTEDSIAVIDYDGRYKGQQIDGAYAEGAEIDMSTNDYLPDFMEGILGRKLGETFTMQVVFPENYADEYAGKTIDFTVTIHGIKKKVTPEYTDEYVKNNTEYDNKADYEKAVRKSLEKARKKESAKSDRLELFNTILEDSKVIKYPEKEYQSRYDNIVATYKSQAEDNDVSFEKYIDEQLGVTEKEFYEQAESAAKDAVKQELVMHQIARLENIDISKKEYTEYLDNLLEESGYSKSEYKKQTGMSIEEYAEQNSLFSSFLYEKVMDKVEKFSKAR